MHEDPYNPRFMFNQGIIMSIRTISDVEDANPADLTNKRHKAADPALDRKEAIQSAVGKVFQAAQEQHNKPGAKSKQLQREALLAYLQASRS